MDCVVICEGSSSAILYITEARKRGLRPIIIYPPRNGDKSEDSFITDFINNAGDDTIVFDVPEGGYVDLVKELKKYSIKAVVAGSEYGVIYGDRLARDLNLNGNNPDTTYMRCTKKGMEEGLKKAGLRSIATAVIECDDDIDRFWDENDISVAFMKQNEGASSTNSMICRTRQDSKDYFSTIAKAPNCYGNTVGTLIQEYIDGKEYAVNTMSCRGHHIITDIWKYELIYNGDSKLLIKKNRIVDAAEPGIKELTEYALKVVDALGFEYGPCHGEYFVDSKGPVLIETNARPMGLCMKADYYEECIGNHIADLALDTFIEPEKYIRNMPESYTKPKVYAEIITPFSPKNARADVWKCFAGVRNLKTLKEIISEYGEGEVDVKKTVDLDSVLMIVKLCGNKKDVVTDIEAVLEMEKAFALSLNGSK